MQRWQVLGIRSITKARVQRKSFLQLAIQASWSYNQLQKYLRRCTVFWLKWPVHDLVLVTPPPPLFKVASNTRPCSKLGGTTLNGGRGEVSILSHRPVTSSDLKQDRLFFRESVSTFLQLVVAFTSPDIISTSPKNFLTSRIDFTVLLLFEFLKKHHLPIKQVKNRNYSLAR